MKLERIEDLEIAEGLEGQRDNGLPFSSTPHAPTRPTPRMPHAPPPFTPSQAAAWE